jgi:hypothetical protein
LFSRLSVKLTLPLGSLAALLVCCSLLLQRSLPGFLLLPLGLKLTLPLGSLAALLVRESLLLRRLAALGLFPLALLLCRLSPLFAGESLLLDLTTLGLLRPPLCFLL